MTKRTARPAKAEKPTAEPHPRDGIGARIEEMLKERDHLTDRLSYHRSAVSDLRVQIGKINQDLREAIGANVEDEPMRAGQIQAARAFLNPVAQQGLSQLNNPYSRFGA